MFRHYTTRFFKAKLTYQLSTNYHEILLEVPKQVSKRISINKTSALFIPKGVDHGPLTWKKVDKPHIQMVVMPGAGTLKESNPAGYLE